MRNFKIVYRSEMTEGDFYEFYTLDGVDYTKSQIVNAVARLHGCTAEFTGGRWYIGINPTWMEIGEDGVQDSPETLLPFLREIPKWAKRVIAAHEKNWERKTK